MNKEACIEIAREATLKMAQEGGDVVGAFICGSMADDKPPMYTDVDIRVILDSEHTPPTKYVIEQGVPLEWVFLPKSKCVDLEDVLNSPFLSLELAKAIILFDPTDFLAKLKMEVLTSYQHRVHVMARAKRLLDAAREMYENVRKCFEKGAFARPLQHNRISQTWHEKNVQYPKNLATMQEMPIIDATPFWSLRCCIFWTGEIPPLLLNETPSHKRLLVKLKDAGERLGHPELYTLGLDTLGVRNIEKWEAEGFLIDALDIIDYVNTKDIAKHFYLSPDKREYWEKGIKELIGQDCSEEATWPVFTIFSVGEPLISQMDTPDSEPYKERCKFFFRRLGCVDACDVERKLLTAEEWLRKTELVIENL